MRKILGLITLMVGLALLYYLLNPISLGETTIPPLGKLLNPYSGAWQNAEDSTDYGDFSLESKYIQNEVKIIFDDRMVPHIFAENLEDAMFAQGYVEAYHRLFQMDLSTRAADGRLSEIFGKKLLPYDQKQRRLGLNFGADNAMKGWSKFPEKLGVINQYTAGVNHFISNLSPADFPIEYKLLDYKPESWSNRHSALLLKAMSQTLVGYEEDIEMSNAYRFLGEEDFKIVYPDRNPKDTPVIRGPYKQTASYLRDNPSDDVIGMNIPSISRPRSPDGVGSNNWAINGRKSETGFPVLANDPHLALSLPSVWYEIAITTPDFSAQGVTLLGMPGIMIGFNQNIAWGETNVGHDMMDYHLIKWTDDSRMSYYLDNKKVIVDLKIEKYQVKGIGELKDTVRYTHWGPVVEDDNSLALRWIAHDVPTSPEFMAFVDGMQCDNYDDYLTATGQFYAPAQNFIYADNSNEIGLRINGKIPIKRNRQGVMISSGSSINDGWKGFIPRELNPQERNPEKGFVSSCNQYSAEASFPYYYNGNFEPYRGRMANRMLSSKDSFFTIGDFMSLQNSTYSILAEEALSVLLTNLDSNNRRHRLAKKLSRWNFHYDANSESPVVFDKWFDAFQKLLWDEIYVQKAKVDLPDPDAWVTINLIESQTKNKFFDVDSTEDIETLKDLVNMSFNSIKAKKYNKLGDDKGAEILHLTRLPAFSETNLFVGGTKHSLNAMQKTFGPSWRMIVALGDQPIAYAIYPGGQSGNPASPYYKNKIKTWAAGEYDKITIASNPNSISNPLFSIKLTNEK